MDWSGSDVWICRECGDPYERERGDGLLQRCGCRRHRDAPRWPGFDYNERVRLCECCHAEALPSGSRWSVWFCAECKHRVVALNTAAGWPVIPIGRHSLMHGIGLDASALTPQDHALAEALADETRSFFDRVGILHEHAQRLCLATLEALGIQEDIRLDSYLGRLRRAAVADPAFSKETMFESLVASLASKGDGDGSR